MTPRSPLAANSDRRVVKFRPRTTTPANGPLQLSASGAAQRDNTHAAGNPQAAVPGEAADEFQHRMGVNAAAFAFTVVLTGFGIWLAVAIADLRDTQNCVLMGRRDCAHLTLPAG